MRHRTKIARWAALAGLALVAPSHASDHDDTNELKTLMRHEARLTDLHVFMRGDQLVLSLCTNPTIPIGATDYAFPADLTLRFAIDNDSAVHFDDAVDLAAYGGTIVTPEHIEEDFVFEITFDKPKGARLQTRGLRGNADKEVRFFSGLRDDPFIRGPRIGRNVAAVVVELPLAAVLGTQSTLLVWATSKVPEIHGPVADLAGRSLRSQMPENLALNTMHPRDHIQQLGMPPDVVIFDTARPCVFPNGRDLNDDVVTMVNDGRILANDAPFPTSNDMPFLDTFPYLAPPQ